MLMFLSLHFSLPLCLKISKILKQTNKMDMARQPLDWGMFPNINADTSSALPTVLGDARPTLHSPCLEPLAPQSQAGEMAGAAESDLGSISGVTRSPRGGVHR